MTSEFPKVDVSYAGEDLTGGKELFHIGVPAKVGIKLLSDYQQIMT